MFQLVPLSLAAAALLVGSTGAPAQAASASFSDVAGDVTVGVDLLSVAVKHGEDKIKVVSTHDNLTASPDSAAGMVLYLDTDRDDKGPEYALVSALFEGGDYTLLAVEGWKVGAKATPVDGFAQVHLDTEEEQATVTIDRDALEVGRHLRVAFRASGEGDDGQERDWLGDPRDFTAPVARG